MSAIESALSLKHQWDTTGAIANLSDGKCKHHGLAIAIHIESLPGDQALSDDIVNATKTFRLLAKVSENFPDSSASFVAITTECLDHLKTKTAISFSQPTTINVRKHASENIEMTYHLVLGDLALASENASCGFYFVKHGLVDVKLDGLCPPINPEVELTLARPLQLHDLRRWIRWSRNRIRILQTYIPWVTELTEDLLDALRRKVDIEVLLLEPRWTMNHIKGMLPDDLRYIVTRKLGPRLVPSFFAIQRHFELDPKPQRGNFPTNIENCRETLEGIQERHKNQGGQLKVYYYDALPGIALHIFDDIMFVGFFLEKKFAVETPQFVIARKGQALFKLFEGEFEQLLKPTPDAGYPGDAPSK